MLRLLSCVALAAPAAALKLEEGESSRHGKHHLVVCNAVPDARPAIVGERPVPLHDLAAAAAGYTTTPPPVGEDVLPEMLDFLQLRVDGGLPPAAVAGVPRRATGHRRVLRARRLRRVPRGLLSAAPVDALWARSMAYGACEEYYIDLRVRRLFFIGAGGEHTCEVSPDGPLPRESPTTAGSATPRMALVLTQPSASHRSCAVHTVPMPSAGEGPVATKELPLRPAEVVAIDAFTRVSPLALRAQRGLDDEDDGPAGQALMARRLDASAELRLEDVIDGASITADVVGSRTMALDQIYMVEPRAFHFILEDLQGTRVLDHTVLSFAPGDVVVALRIGRGGDPSFPERLVAYRCKRKSAEPAPPPL